MTVIDLSHNMVDRAAERGFYEVLVVGNAELVVLLPAAADPSPALNAPRYADVKVKVINVNVNVNGRGCIDVNGRYVGGEGGGELKDEKGNDGGRGGGGGAKFCRQQKRSYDAVFP